MQSVISASFSDYKTPLPWKTRFNIALGVTEAFAFLDRRQIWDYNRTIKPHQILLDKVSFITCDSTLTTSGFISWFEMQDFNAKVSDAELETLGKVYSYELNEDRLYYQYLPNTSKFLQFLLTFYNYSYFPYMLKSKLNLSDFYISSVT